MSWNVHVMAESNFFTCPKAGSLSLKVIYTPGIIESLWFAYRLGMSLLNIWSLFELHRKLKSTLKNTESSWVYSLFLWKPQNCFQFLLKKWPKILPNELFSFLFTILKDRSSIDVKLKSSLHFWTRNISYNKIWRNVTLLQHSYFN